MVIIADIYRSIESALIDITILIEEKKKGLGIRQSHVVPPCLSYVGLPVSSKKYCLFLGLTN